MTLASDSDTITCGTTQIRGRGGGENIVSVAPSGQLRWQHSFTHSLRYGQALWGTILIRGLACAANRVKVVGAFRYDTLFVGPFTLLSQPTPHFSWTGWYAEFDASPLGTAAELPQAAPLTLYPNPARAEVRLSPAPAAPLTVLDGLGRVVARRPAGTASFSVAGWPPGVYAVHTGQQVRRLVVE